MFINSYRNNSNNTNDNILERIFVGGFAFSILSLIGSIIICLIIIFNKILRSLTYNFLLCIFLSEILNNIGKICEFRCNNDQEYLCKISWFLIPFSDVLTSLLFSFFSYCSIQLIKKSNRSIKEKELHFFLSSSIIALFYSLIIFMALFYFQNNENERFYYNGNDNFNYIGHIHAGVLICCTLYTTFNIKVVVNFLKEKQKSDKINSWKIAKLIKVFSRYYLICIMYWIFYIPSYNLLKYKNELKITYMISLFSVSFLSLRGFLIFLNTLQTNKIQILIQRIIEIYIKHYLLYFDIYGQMKRKYSKKKEKILEQNDNNNDD